MPRRRVPLAESAVAGRHNMVWDKDTPRRRFGPEIALMPGWTESTVGAKGLMQVIPKYHLDKLTDHGGEQSLLDPYVNIMVGSQILREYQRRLGDTEAALQMYGGAFDEPTSQYANKVLAEKARLELLRQKAKKSTSA